MKGEINISTIDLDVWRKFIRKYYNCNNYRKLHGMPMRRRKHITKARRQRYLAFVKKSMEPMKIGPYTFFPPTDNHMRFMYTGEK